MNESYNQLLHRLARVSDLWRASAVLNWDKETQMPPGGRQQRADQIGTLRALAHDILSGGETGRLLDDLEPWAADLPYDSVEASVVRVARRDYDKAVKVPTEWVEREAKVTSLAHHDWVKAKDTNDFPVFVDALKEILDLKRERAEFFAPYDDVYDPLLDDFEPGMTTAYAAEVLGGVRPHLVELTRAISEEGRPVDDTLLQRPLPHDKQVAFGRMLAADVGYDLERGRLDLSAHPFTTGFGRDDVRITTIIDPRNFFRCIKSSIHEAGHAMHGQNTAPELYRTGLDRGAGMAVGESQSRFFENIVGRSRAYWTRMFPILQHYFAPLLDDLTLDDYYPAINKVFPSLIRVKADEVTYGLHIILRFELEHDLINGRTPVETVNQEWNARMEEYLGIVPPTDTEGVLQDIHWSSGLFGYFPDYQLGSMFAVQLWNAMQQDLPDAEDRIASGDIAPILGWLADNIMRHGRKFTLPELAERATGGPLDWRPYVDYCWDKFGEIYGIKK